MTQFKLNHFAVLVQEAAGPREYEVTCYHPDRLRAEREAPKYGLNVKIAKGDDDGPNVSNILGQNLLTAEVWSAMRREQFYAKSLGDFIYNDCLAVESLEDVVLDPTQATSAAVTGSPSSSAEETTSLQSPSGSTPQDPAEIPAWSPPPSS